MLWPRHPRAQQIRVSEIAGPPRQRVVLPGRHRLPTRSVRAGGPVDPAREAITLEFPLTPSHRRADALPLANQTDRQTGMSAPHRARIGMVVTRSHESIFLRCMVGIVNRFPQRKFDVVVLCAASAIATVQQALHHPDVSVAVLPEHFPAAVATIEAPACGLLCGHGKPDPAPPGQLAPRN
jgi:hypothetical protein